MNNSSGTRPFGSLTSWSCLFRNHEEINIESERRKPFSLERIGFASLSRRQGQE